MTEAPPILLLAAIIVIIVGSIALAGFMARTLEDHLKEKDK
jgi:hypothetical protein